MDSLRGYLLLDAMGVMYRAWDDVSLLLHPFLRSRNIHIELADLVSMYVPLSKGHTDVDEFWRSFGLDESAEDVFLSAHALSPGLLPFLALSRTRYRGVFCLSNDVSRWSLKLRRQFGLERYISRWFISGDLGLRKPDPAIFCAVLKELPGVDPSELLFVDDTYRNLNAAKACGLRTCLFTACRPDAAAGANGHAVADSFDVFMDPGMGKQIP